VQIHAIGELIVLFHIIFLRALFFQYYQQSEVPINKIRFQKRFTHITSEVGSFSDPSHPYLIYNAFFRNHILNQAKLIPIFHLLT
jgi:hypothetical protein